jgi:hypothetical protein
MSLLQAEKIQKMDGKLSEYHNPRPLFVEYHKNERGIQSKTSRNTKSSVKTLSQDPKTSRRGSRDEEK